jgi:hypothetical protein
MWACDALGTNGSVSQMSRDCALRTATVLSLRLAFAMSREAYGARVFAAQGEGEGGDGDSPPPTLCTFGPLTTQTHAMSIKPNEEAYMCLVDASKTAAWIDAAAVEASRAWAIAMARHPASGGNHTAAEFEWSHVATPSLLTMAPGAPPAPWARGGRINTTVYLEVLRDAAAVLRGGGNATLASSCPSTCFPELDAARISQDVTTVAIICAMVALGIAAAALILTPFVQRRALVRYEGSLGLSRLIDGYFFHPHEVDDVPLWSLMMARCSHNGNGGRRTFQEALLGGFSQPCERSSTSAQQGPHSHSHGHSHGHGGGHDDHDDHDDHDHHHGCCHGGHKLERSLGWSITLLFAIIFLIPLFLIMAATFLEIRDVPRRPSVIKPAGMKFVFGLSMVVATGFIGCIAFVVLRGTRSRNEEPREEESIFNRYAAMILGGVYTVSLIGTLVFVILYAAVAVAIDANRVATAITFAVVVLSQIRSALMASRSDALSVRVALSAYAERCNDVRQDMEVDTEEGKGFCVTFFCLFVCLFVCVSFVSDIFLFVCLRNQSRHQERQV